MCPPVQPHDLFPENFSLIAPERAEALLTTRPPKDVLSFFATHDSPWLWATFAKPVDDVHPTQTYHRRPPTRPSPIEALPNELLDIIIDALDEEKRDILSLGLASSIFWPVVLRHIHSKYRHHAAPWAGTKIAFHGHHSWSSVPVLLENAPRRVVRVLKSFQYYGLHRFQGSSEFEDLRPMDHGWIERLRKLEIQQWEGFSAADWSEIEQDLSSNYLFPQDRVWVLRNISKAQYIRSDRLQMCPHRLERSKEKPISVFDSIWRFVGLSQPYQPQNLCDQSITFAQILLCMTRWSTRRFVPTEPGSKGLTGYWVGHRFDIVTLDYHNSEQLQSRTNWLDISEEAVQIVLDIRNEALKGSSSKWKNIWA